MTQPSVTVIEGVAEELSPRTYAALADIKADFDAVAAKDALDPQEVLDLYRRALVRLARAVAAVEIDLGAAQGRITPD